jgi:hypothetical protein
MHLLLIILLLMIALPILGRLVGSIPSMLFWLIVVVAAYSFLG